MRKICKLVCQMTEDIDYEYDVDYDEYCLPATSKIRGRKWLPDCSALLGCRKLLIWQPRCQCKIHTRKTLVKIPVVKKVPTYNCVVECVCCQCGKSRVDAEATAKAREQGIRPDSVDTSIVLDEPASVDLLISDARRNVTRSREWVDPLGAKTPEVGLDRHSQISNKNTTDPSQTAFTLN